jgi:hypothetical protein
LTKHTVVSALISLVTFAILLAGVGLASFVMATLSSGHAHARTVCRIIHNHQICREVVDPMPPKPDPKGTKMK